ncbi:P52 family lipoprotein (plasmid) [Borreliella yangtzensis]|uniref:Lipoprotein n=1 Tax=Borreliella yangtzensis TaxID=683292 RepID=A0ABR6PBB4_9SPIR|nr:hypothetical protein [Borreliella yangtzensis]
MKILVGACIMILALLSCHLPDRQEQVVQTFFENLEKSYDAGPNEIVTEGKFSNLKLYVPEHRLLIDIKKTLIRLKDPISLKDPNYRGVPPVFEYNDEYFNKFFLDLGSERSKDLIRLFSIVKNEQNDKFERDVYWLYSCIRELYSTNIQYSGEVVGDYVIPSRPTIDQQYFKVKKEIEKNTLG